MPDTSDREQLAATLKSIGDATSLSLHSSRWWGVVADALLAEGIRLPARVITDPEVLDALPERSVVVASRSGTAWQRAFGDKWIGDGGVQLYSDDLLHNYGPAVVLVHTPAEIGDTDA